MRGGAAGSVGGEHLREHRVVGRTGDEDVRRAPRSA